MIGIIKKISQLALIVIVAFFVSGCGKQYSPNSSDSNQRPVLNEEQNNAGDQSGNAENISPKDTDENCVKLGEAGPNGSLGPNDPNVDKKCCEGLKLKMPIRCSSELNGAGICRAMEGCGTVCIACGDGKCDSVHENRCNCPEDCK